MSYNTFCCVFPQLVSSLTAAVPVSDPKLVSTAAGAIVYKGIVKMAFLSVIISPLMR